MLCWIIIGIFWFCSSLLCLLQNGEAINEVKDSDKNIVYIIYIVGGPFFMITNVLEEILDLLLPQGWDVDDKNSLS